MPQNNLTPTLNSTQIRENIDALQQKGVSTSDIQAYVNNYQKSSDGSYILKGYQPAPKPAAQPSPGLPGSHAFATPTAPVVSNPMTDIQKAGAQVNEDISTPGNPIVQGTKAASDAATAIPNAAADVIPGGKAILGALGEGYTNAVNNTADAIKWLGDKIGSTQPVQDFVNKNPGLIDKVLSTSKDAAEVGNNLGNIANVILMAKGGAEGIQKTADAVPQAVGAIKNAATNVKNFAKPTAPATPILDEAKVTDLYNRAIKPSVSGKTGAGQIAKANKQIITGAQAIVDNKPSLTFTDANGEITGQSPKTVDQFTQAIEQTKKSIFQKYDTIAKQTGEKGVTVNPAEVTGELDSVINNKAVQLANPSAVAYAKEVQSRLSQVGEMTPSELQDTIAVYNNKLKTYYGNPTPQGFSEAAVDALMVNKLREQLDSAILSRTGGEAYQSLREQYGALSSIEKDVAHRNVVWARQNNVGLPGNLANITSGAELARGLITMNPADIAASLAIKGVQKYMQYLNNPDVGVSRLFSEIERTSHPSTGNSTAPEGENTEESSLNESIPPSSQKVKSDKK